MCIFCDIVNGKIPCYKIYENNNAMAFLDLANDSNGHTLVIPKKHFKNILDCDKNVLCDVIEMVQKISKHYVDDCGADGVDIFNANGEIAEQSVFHLHFHILPRYKNDGVKVFPALKKNVMSLEELADKLKMK